VRIEIFFLPRRLSSFMFFVLPRFLTLAITVSSDRVS
jgi:hypothetical protein